MGENSVAVKDRTGPNILNLGTKQDSCLSGPPVRKPSSVILPLICKRSGCFPLVERGDGSEVCTALSYLCTLQINTEQKLCFLDDFKMKKIWITSHRKCGKSERNKGIESSTRLGFESLLLRYLYMEQRQEVRLAIGGKPHVSSSNPAATAGIHCSGCLAPVRKKALCTPHVRNNSIRIESPKPISHETIVSLL